MKALTWIELAALDEGAMVIFAGEHDFGSCVAPVGTVAMVTENSLNGLGATMVLGPMEEDFPEGELYLTAQVTFGDDPSDTSSKWYEVSPLALV